MVTDDRSDAGRRRWWRHDNAPAWLAAEQQHAGDWLNHAGRRQIVILQPLGLPPLTLAGEATFTCRYQGDYWRDCVRSDLAVLPFLDDCLDVIVWRYLDVSPAMRQHLLTQIYRCLRPGGQLLMATLNPLQPACWRACDWRELGGQALDLTWPLRLQGFRPLDNRNVGGKRLLRPVRLQLLCKPGDGRRPLHLPSRLMKSNNRRPAGTVPSCRAA